MCTIRVLDELSPGGGAVFLIDLASSEPLPIPHGLLDSSLRSDEPGVVEDVRGLANKAVDYYSSRHCPQSAVMNEETTKRYTQMLIFSCDKILAVGLHLEVQYFHSFAWIPLYGKNWNCLLPSWNGCSSCLGSAQHLASLIILHNERLAGRRTIAFSAVEAV